MNRDLLHTILLAGLFLSLFGVAELMYHQFKVKVELTRKFVHVGTGLLTLLFPVLLGNHWLVLLLCTSFALILIASLKFNLLKSINAIERESVGSLAYPVSVYACYLAFDYFGQQYIYFYLPVLILAICDPVAALTGKTWPVGKYKVGKENKTLLGSSMFFLSALVLGFLLFRALNPQLALAHILLSTVLVALISSIAEALSRKGYDNLTIPAAVLLTLIFTRQMF